MEGGFAPLALDCIGNLRRPYQVTLSTDEMTGEFVATHLLLAWTGAILTESSKKLRAKDGHEEGKAAFAKHWAAQNPERRFFAIEGFEDEVLQTSLRLGTNPMLFLATISQEVAHLDLNGLALKTCRFQ